MWKNIKTEVVHLSVRGSWPEEYSGVAMSPTLAYARRDQNMNVAVMQRPSDVIV